MSRYLFSILTIVIALSASAFSQTTPPKANDPAPTSKPAVKRRGLDQFGLSGGVFSSSGSTSSGENEPQETIAEPVGAKLGDVFHSVGYLLQSLESTYREVYQKRNESRYGGVMPERFVFDHLIKSHASPAALRGGVFEGQPFKNPRNAALFEDLRITLDDLITATSRMQADTYPNGGSTTMGLVQKYSIPTFENEVGQSTFATRNLVLAIFARARGDINRLQRQIVIVR